MEIIIKVPVDVDGPLSVEDQKGLRKLLEESVPALMVSTFAPGARICEFARFAFLTPKVKING